jgi:stage IV sporulation protein B
MKKLIIKAVAAALTLWLLTGQAYAVESLIPVGRVIGLELSNNTVTIVAFDDSIGGNAKAAGLKIGDEIIHIDGTTIDCAQDVRDALTHSDGQIQLRIRRSSKEHDLHLTPEITCDGPRLGVFLREGITGIGTVTWYDPKTGAFGSLGHGVNTTGGELVKMQSGNVYNATVQSVKQGKIGQPGQLRGAVEGTVPLGTIRKNTQQGVFGSVSRGWEGDAVPVASKDAVKTGCATIRSTVAGQQVQDYSVEILKIYPDHKAEGRNMLIRVTDPTLLKATGGIVQGMSGSPIIQDGKLIGAVTHVLVNDPTTGYGIFIENMLNAAA